MFQEYVQPPFSHGLELYLGSTTSDVLHVHNSLSRTTVTNLSPLKETSTSKIAEAKILHQNVNALRAVAALYFTPQATDDYSRRRSLDLGFVIALSRQVTTRLPVYSGRKDEEWSTG